MAFSKHLNEIMNEFQIKNIDLARESGLSQSYISKIRRGISMPKDGSLVYEKLFRGLEALLNETQREGLKEKFEFPSDRKSLQALFRKESSKVIGHFSNCLNILMNFFKIQNKSLAEVLNCDPSLISKYRGGERIPSMDNEMVIHMTHYFSFLAISEGKGLALCKVMGMEEIEHINEKILSELILKWMLQGEMDALLMDKIFNMMENYQETCVDYSKLSKILESTSLPYQEVMKKQGKEGIRKQVLLFLSLIAKSEKTLELKLFSDQSMDWMTEDPEFFNIWRTLMLTILICGHRVQIIHNILRTDRELYAALEGWLPLHLSGNIESYYYKLPASDLFSNTLFINCGEFAVVGNSVVGLEDEADFYFTKDEGTLKRVEHVFDSLIENSEELLQTFSLRSYEDAFLFADRMMDTNKDSTIYLIQQKLPLWTMNENLLIKILEENQVGIRRKEFILEYAQFLRESYDSLLENNEYYEYFYIPEKFEEKKYILDGMNIFGEEPIYYTIEDFKAHLKDIRNILRESKNYHIAILEEPMFSEMKLLQFKDKNIFAIKTKPPTSAISYQSELILQKCQSYMMYKLKDTINSIDHYDEVLSVLEDWGE
ncbi:MAG: hypothetical protein Q4Q07_00020 [Tissierellia bacterium]|nr:hypothetical protein [Tissierellia bacterium]